MYRSATSLAIALAVLIGDVQYAHAQAAAQSIPYRATSDSLYDYNEGAIDSPMSASIPDGYWIASPLGAGEYNVMFIEAGFIRFGDNSDESSCESVYCAYSTYGGEISGSDADGFVIDHT